MPNPDSQLVRASEAKSRFSELLARAEAGEEITITKRGTPVAKLVRLNPKKPKRTPAQRRAAIERIKALSNEISLGGLKIRDLINEGRR